MLDEMLRPAESAFHRETGYMQQPAPPLYHGNDTTNRPPPSGHLHLHDAPTERLQEGTGGGAEMALGRVVKSHAEINAMLEDRRGERPHDHHAGRALMSR